MAEKKELLNIEEVFPDVDALKQANLKSVDDLKKTNMFSHIAPEKQDAAYAKLWDIINPKAPAPIKTVAQS